MAARVERELVLFKLRAPPGPARTELLQLVDIFRARVIDVSGVAHREAWLIHLDIFQAQSIRIVKFISHVAR